MLTFPTKAKCLATQNSEGESVLSVFSSEQEEFYVFFSKFYLLPIKILSFQSIYCPDSVRF